VTLLNFVGEECKRKVCDVCCFPGIRVEELQHQMEKTDSETECPNVIVIHAVTNNIRRGISATEITGDTMDLVDTTRNKFLKQKL
jgi:uncharacterized Rossmann fold enzyme